MHAFDEERILWTVTGEPRVSSIYTDSQATATGHTPFCGLLVIKMKHGAAVPSFTLSSRRDGSYAIASVLPGSQAARLGLGVGDVILAIGNTRLQHKGATVVQAMLDTRKTLKLIVRPSSPASRLFASSKHNVKLSAASNGTPMLVPTSPPLRKLQQPRPVFTLEVDSGASSTDVGDEYMVTMRAPPTGQSLGFSVQGGLPQHARLWISHVAEGSIAQHSGMHVGSRVLSINGCPTHSMTHAMAAICIRHAVEAEPCLRLSLEMPPTQVPRDPAPARRPRPLSMPAVAVKGLVHAPVAVKDTAVTPRKLKRLSVQPTVRAPTLLSPVHTKPPTATLRAPLMSPTLAKPTPRRKLVTADLFVAPVACDVPAPASPPRETYTATCTPHQSPRKTAVCDDDDDTDDNVFGFNRSLIDIVLHASPARPVVQSADVATPPPSLPRDFLPDAPVSPLPSPPRERTSAQVAATPAPPPPPPLPTTVSCEAMPVPPTSVQPRISVLDDIKNFSVGTLRKTPRKAATQGAGAQGMGKNDVQQHLLMSLQRKFRTLRRMPSASSITSEW